METEEFQPPDHIEERTVEETRELLKDPNHLATHAEVNKAFPPDPEQLFSQEWHNFCFDKDNLCYELLNEEHLESLSDYLVERMNSIGASIEKPVTILEIGAGNGRLSHFLEEKLDRKAFGKAKVVATDSGEWGLRTNFPVEQLEHKQALEEYNPDIVICSWMPYLKDFTADFRATSSVKEYILVGETDDGCSGHEWHTWGNDWDNEHSNKGDLKPYEEDGFERADLEEISDKQICRMDLLGSKLLYKRHSRTVSFRRIVSSTTE